MQFSEDRIPVSSPLHCHTQLGRPVRLSTELSRTDNKIPGLTETDGGSLAKLSLCKNSLQAVQSRAASRAVIGQPVANLPPMNFWRMQICGPKVHFSWLHRRTLNLVA